MSGPYYNGGGGGGYGGYDNRAPRGRGGGGYRGGGRRENNDFHPYSRQHNNGPPRFHGNRDLPANPEQHNAGIRYRDFVLKLGEQSGFKTEEDLPRLSGVLSKNWAANSASILEGLTYGIVEQPYKIPLYAALILSLSQEIHALPPASVPSTSSLPPSTETAEDDVEAALGATDGGGSGGGGMEVDGENTGTGEGGKEKGKGKEAEAMIPGKRLHLIIIEELGKRLTEWVKGKEWSNARIMLQLFAHLTSLRLISSTSFISTLGTFSASLKTSSLARGEHILRTITDVLIRSGPTFYSENSEAVDAMVGEVEQFTKRVVGGKRKMLNDSGLMASGSGSEEDGEAEMELVETLTLVLGLARKEEFQFPKFLIPEAEQILASEGEDAPVAFDLTALEIPEEDETVVEGAESWIGSLTANQEEIGVTDARVPDPETVDGFCMTSLLLDIIDIFEINRGECARILLNIFPNYVQPDTFQPPPPRPAEGETQEFIEGYWVLYSTITSVILSALLRLPQSKHKRVYYMALVRELCALQPSDMAPPVGLAARKLYEKIGSGRGLDVALSSRLAEWLSGHLSNFAFAWMWNAWAVDLPLPKSHPKRAFMHRVIEQEIRLAYYDRIMGSLPVAMKEEKDVPMLNDPAPVYPFDFPNHPLFEQSTDIIAKLRARSDASEILASIREMASVGPEDPIPTIYRQLVISAILFVGSRSFSHFLNATERYRPVLLAVTTSSKERRDLVEFAGDFWQNNVQLLAVTYDKYINNGLIDSEDIVPYVFGKMSLAEEGSEADAPTVWTNGHAWDILKMLLDKVRGRVEGRRRMLKELEDEAAARPADEMEVDDGTSEEISSARDLLAKRQREHDATMFSVAQKFVQSLVGGTVDGLENLTECEARLEAALDAEMVEEVEDAGLWDSLARLGWFKEFCRTYGSSLKSIKETVGAEVFDRLPNKSEAKDPALTAAATIRELWEEATA